MKTIFWGSISAAAMMAASAAQAQTATTDPTDAARPSEAAIQDDEIVVTAERRSVSLQRAPVAATVLTGEDLVRKGVNGVEQLQFASPSLTVNSAGQGNAFNIRGIGKTEQTTTVGVGVITYRDGVATMPGYFQTEPYYDIASVEVLRGPQGTFAGGNATGGAVFITEKNPDLQGVNGYALAQYGNYNHLKLQGAVNLPISSTLALRLAGNTERRDTFYKISGPWTGNPGDRRDYSGRASLLWQPSAQLRVLIKGDYNSIEFGGLPAGAATDTGDPLVISSNARLAGRDEFGRVVANISYTFDNGLMLRSISGFQRGTTKVDLDNDGTGAAGTPTAPAIQFHDNISEEVWSQEFNIISPDTGRFTWLLGGYWQHDNLFIPAGNGFVVDVTPNTFAPLNIDVFLQGTTPRSALAVFGQAGYELTDGLQLQVGARWSRTTVNNNVLTTTPQVPTLRLAQNDFLAAKKVNGKIALNWTIDPSNYLYAFAATGTKAGGLNAPNLAGVQPLAFKAEDVTDFEIGWKSSFADGRVRTQLGGYYNIYENFQVSIVDPRAPSISSLFNVPGKTKLYGVEFSVQGSFDAFTFDLNGSVSNSRLGRFFAADARLGAAPAVCNPTSGPATARCLNLDGIEQPYAPKFTISAGAQYAIPLGDEATLTPRIDYAHIGAVWGTLFQNPARGDRLAARDIVNAQLTLATGDWLIAAYGSNLTDQHYVGAINGVRRLAGAPRQYGLRVSRSF